MNLKSGIHAAGCIGLMLSTTLPAAAPEHGVRLQSGDTELIIPADSPVKLHKLADGQAEFSGQFVLSGRYTFGCTDECTKPFPQKDMVLLVSPDKATVARLPHWRGFHSPDTIEIENASAFVEKAISRQTMHALIYGKKEWATGYTSILVDHFFTSVECDDSFASARFRAFAKAAPERPVRVGVDGCG